MDQNIKAILFDLDGTLLPMDQDLFVAAYGKELGKFFAAEYDPHTLVKNVMRGVGVMVANQGEKSNYDAFWEFFSDIYGKEILGRIPDFTRFYETAFNNAKAVCGFSEYSAKIVQALKSKGYRLILATNPLFPPVATENRIRWAGLRPEDFEYITHYENSCHCKPNLDYYRDILQHCGLKPEECMMVGNDVGEDMCTLALGMQTYLITDCIINRTEHTLEEFRHGSLEDFYRHITN